MTTNAQVSATANRFMEKVQQRQEALQLTAAQKQAKIDIDKEYKDFIDVTAVEQQEIQDNYQLAVVAAQEVLKESLKDLHDKRKNAKEMRIEEYVKAGIAKEHIPATDVVAVKLDNAATKLIGGAASFFNDTKDYLKRKAAGQVG
jgi:hypothetical protein